LILSSIYCLNEQGRRDNTEDTVYPHPGKALLSDKLFLVCDGVGGESKGEEASRIACEAIPAYFENTPQKAIDAGFLQKAAGCAVSKLQEYATLDPAADRMSTTLTLCYLERNNIAVAWCGDSRIYHIRGGNILWKSTDHSLVMMLVKQGELTEDEARRHPNKNAILRSLSAAPGNGTIDTHFIHDYQSGDFLLLCTDGLLENIDEQALHEILSPENAKKDRRNLFLNYCQEKTDDNFSMYLLELNESATNRSKINSGRVIKDRKKRKTVYLVFIASIALIGLLIIFTSGILTRRKSQPTVLPPGVNPVKTTHYAGRDSTSKSTDSSLLNILNNNTKANKN